MFRLAPLTLCPLAAVVALSGCVINASSSNRGVIEVQWRAGPGWTCTSLGASTVRVRLHRDGTLYDAIGNIPCERGVQTATVPEGRYVVSLEGLTGAGVLVAQSAAVELKVSGGSTVTTGVLDLLPPGSAGANVGSVAVSWTLQGEAPASACGKAGIKDVAVSALDEGKAKVLATVKVACTANHATLPNVPAGDRWLQLDGYDAAGKLQWGNATLFGPVKVPAGMTLDVQGAIDLVPLQGQGVGAVTAQWTVGGMAAGAGCAKNGLQTVVMSVLDDQKAKILKFVEVPCAQGTATVQEVPAGTRWLQFDAYPGKPAGNPLFGNANLTGPIQIVANQTAAVASLVDLVPLGAAPQKGSVSVAWTVLGKDAATGCAQAQLKTVYVSVLDETRSKTVAPVAEVPCALGNAMLKDVAFGTVWVQLDAVPSTGVSWGNVNLAGPIQVAGDALVQTQNVDLRSVVTLDWKFADGLSCAQHNVGEVLVEVRDAANKVVVSLKDKDAKKPCAIAGTSVYTARVIDLLSADGKCAVPPGAKGLVLCNVGGGTLKLAVSALDQTSGQVVYGGSMQIENIKPATYAQLTTALELKACAQGNPCAVPVP